MTAVMTRVEHWRLHVAGSDGNVAHQGRDALHDAVATALERVSKSLGEEVVLLRRVEISWRVALSAEERPTIAALLAPRIEKLVANQVASARAAGRAHGSYSWIAEDGAWFANQAIHAAECLLTVQGNPWWTGLPAARGAALHSWSSRDDAADVLAHLVRRACAASGASATPAVIVGFLSRSVEPEALVVLDPGVWIDEHSARLPSEVEAMVRPFLEYARPASADEQALARVVALGRLYELWPPFRSASSAAAPSRDRVRSDDADVSSPGGWSATSVLGLLYWADLLERSELGSALRSGFNDPRAERFARLALALALEDARTPLTDPLLRLFASEAPEAALWLAPGADLSAEPMLRVALMAASRHAPSLAMQLVQLGDEWHAFAGGLPFDSGVGRATDAVHRIVATARSVLGRAPEEVRILSEAPPRLVSLAAEVDVPRLEERWRGAARALAAHLFALAREEGVDPMRLRNQGARVAVSEEGAVVAPSAPVEPALAMLLAQGRGTRVGRTLVRIRE